jgi:hypothetical protein
MKLIRCRKCRAICTTAICSACKAKEARDRASAGRGALTHEHYDAEYIRNRKAMLRDFEVAHNMRIYCCICHRPIVHIEDVSIEHIIPVARGGTSVRSNLDYAHKKCNYGNRHNRRRAA